LEHACDTNDPSYARTIASKTKKSGLSTVVHTGVELAVRGKKELTVALRNGAVGRADPEILARLNAALRLKADRWSERCSRRRKGTNHDGLSSIGAVAGGRTIHAQVHWRTASSSRVRRDGFPPPRMMATVLKSFSHRESARKPLRGEGHGGQPHRLDGVGRLARMSPCTLSFLTAVKTVKPFRLIANVQQ
jgi:hypothetical protein